MEHFGVTLILDPVGAQLNSVCKFSCHLFPFHPDRVTIRAFLLLCMSIVACNSFLCYIKVAAYVSSEQHFCMPIVHDNVRLVVIVTCLWEIDRPNLGNIYLTK